MKKIIKIIIGCTCALLLLNACALSKKYSSRNIEDYEIYLKEVIYPNDEIYYFMPKLEDVGSYKEFVVTRRTLNDYFFDTTESIGLYLTYDDEEYQKEKDKINEEYYLLNNEKELPDDYVITTYPNGEEHTMHDEIKDNLKDLDANVNGFHIQVVYLDFLKYNTYKHFYCYPHNLKTIGFNDRERKVCYLYHYDSELDEIDNLDKFIKKHYYFPN